MAEEDETCLRLQPALREETESRPEDRSAQCEWERFPEEPTSHPAVARADRSEDTDRGSAVRESPCLSGMNPERHEHPKESGDPVRHDTHGARRLGDGGRQVVPGRTADSGPKDEIRNPLVRRRIARDIRPREVRAAHVPTPAESPEEVKKLARLGRQDADRMKLG